MESVREAITKILSSRVIAREAERDEYILKADEGIMDQIDWSALSRDEKNKQLYLKQKDILDKFLERNAITKVDYDKCLGDLTRIMGMEQLLLNLSANQGDRC